MSQEMDATKKATLSRHKLLEDRARKILISIVVFAIVLLIAIVIVSVVISYIRQEVATASINFDVGNEAVWKDPGTVCDPYGIEQGKYRLNFYCGPSAFAHTVVISEQIDGEAEVLNQLARVIVPQDTPPTNLNYSYILPHPGSYIVTNYSNNRLVGQILFTYPNACGTN